MTAAAIGVAIFVFLVCLVTYGLQALIVLAVVAMALLRLAFGALCLVFWCLLFPFNPKLAMAAWRGESLSEPTDWVGNPLPRRPKAAVVETSPEPAVLDAATEAPATQRSSRPQNGWYELYFGPGSEHANRPARGSKKAELRK